MDSFDVEPEGDDFLVRGTVAQAVAKTSLREIWGGVPTRRDPELGLVGIKASATACLDLRYTPKDLDRLEQEGQARRHDSQAMPDATSLSQLLRAVGAYLNQKRARLLKISRNEEAVTVSYETSSGQRNEEVLTVSALYDFWVRMYMKRAGRNGH